MRERTLSEEMDSWGCMNDDNPVDVPGSGLCQECYHRAWCGSPGKKCSKCYAEAWRKKEI